MLAHTAPPAAPAELAQDAQAALAQLSHLLPPLARELVAELGAAKGVLFIQTFARQRIHIPASSQGAGKLIDRLHTLLGAHSTRRLVQRWGKQSLLVPACQDALTELRNVQLLCDYQGGARVNDLALRYALSARTIERILAKPCSLAHESAAAQALARQAAQGDLF